MIIKFIGFLIFLLITISGFWCIIFLSIFSGYWMIIFLKKILYDFIKKIKIKYFDKKNKN
ncbi:hypothetical protein [Blattabacterium cuenoti]|uniref:hypothetical protein n=1 Tax=Blattabacterium cuenoti TaxID=1653831 RepID=UPI00163CA055|nr:hypothetical protein [Blattabacterium cuenoti]